MTIDSRTIAADIMCGNARSITVGEIWAHIGQAYDTAEIDASIADEVAELIAKTGIDLIWPDGSTNTELDAARVEIERRDAGLAALRAELDRVRAQLTAANHRADGNAADLRSAKRANDGYAQQVAELQRALDGERAAHQKTRDHFEACSKEWAEATR